MQHHADGSMWYVLVTDVNDSTMETQALLLAMGQIEDTFWFQLRIYLAHISQLYFSQILQHVLQTIQHSC